ncbi:hypothetical protein CPB83DRAFT_906590 [Crepidotus variabilis]|uniref:Uncharacterized protein n=1 Tax=Crepidotus variabilis TaxID=179855 RepID=A0A9P6JQ48_9AGAR|nr:hypothetical protein CPB83DRAFT_906590 [Crepidotus variabilis]
MLALDMGNQLSQNPTAGSNFGGFLSRQVSSSYSPSYQVPSSLASAFLPAAMNLNFHLSQKIDFSLIEGRILRGALSTTLLGGGVTLSYYASTLMKQRVLDGVDKTETSFVDSGLCHPSDHAFKWHKYPTGHPPTEYFPKEDLEHRNLAGSTGNNLRLDKRSPVAFENSTDDHVRVRKFINGSRSILLKYFDIMKPIQTQLEVFARTLLYSNSRIDYEPFFASAWSALAMFVGLYYAVMANRRRYQASFVSARIPRIMSGDPGTISPNARGQTQTLGTSCTKSSLRYFMSDRGVPLRVLLFSYNGELLFTLDEVAFRDSRLDPYGTIIEGGSGSPGAKAALLGSTGVNYIELCFRSSGINRDWETTRHTAGAAPRLTLLATTARTELGQYMNTTMSLRTTTVSSCGWIGAALVKLVVGIMGLVIISFILVMSLPLQLVSFFFFTQAMMEIDEKVQDSQANSPNVARRVTDVRNGKRLAKKESTPARPGDIVAAMASALKRRQKSKPSNSSKVSQNLAHIPPDVTEGKSTVEVLDIGDSMVLVDLKPTVAIVPATPSLDIGASIASDLNDLKLCATPESFLIDEDSLQNTTGQTGDVSDVCVSVDVEKVTSDSEQQSAVDLEPSNKDNICEQPRLKTPQVDPLAVHEQSLHVEHSDEDVAVIASPTPEAFAGFESMDATILVSGGSSITSVDPSSTVLNRSSVVQMHELNEVDRSHLSALSALELAINGKKNTADHQKIVDDVVEAHIRSVEERADRTLTTSIWSDMSSGSFQSNAQLLSSAQPEQKLPGPAAMSVVKGKANMRLGGESIYTQRATTSQGAPTDAIELASLPIVNIPCAVPRLDIQNATSSSFSFNFSPSSSQAGPSTPLARVGRIAGEGRAQVQRGGHRAGVGRRWGAPAQRAKPRGALVSAAATKKRTVDGLPVPDWAKA